MSDALLDAFNEQITLEFASSHSYLQLAAYFSDASLTGFEDWMRAQSEEERVHALRFFDFVLARGYQVVLGGIDAPDDGPTSPAEAFEIALTQERHVTAQIAALYELAQAEGDSASYPLLQWFLNEQIEEEDIVSEILDQLKFAGDNPAAVLMLDREYAGRSASSE